MVCRQGRASGCVSCHADLVNPRVTGVKASPMSWHVPREPSTDTDTSTDTSPRTDPDTVTSTNTGSLSPPPGRAFSVGRLSLPDPHCPGLVLWSPPMTRMPLLKLVLGSATAAAAVAAMVVTPSAPCADAADGPARPPANARYRDAKAPVAERVADLLARMTPAEKVAQLMSVNWEHTHLDDATTHKLSLEAAKKLIGNGIGEITRPSDRHSDAKSATEFANAIQKYLVQETRLGIPMLMHEEALHGYVARDATSFPQAIALACTWDPDLAEQIFAVAAREMRARGAHHGAGAGGRRRPRPALGPHRGDLRRGPYLVSRDGRSPRSAASRARDPAAGPTRCSSRLKHMTGHGQPENGTNVGPAQICRAHPARESSSRRSSARCSEGRSSARHAVVQRDRRRALATPTAGC